MVKSHQTFRFANLMMDGACKWVGLSPLNALFAILITFLVTHPLREPVALSLSTLKYYESLLSLVSCLTESTINCSLI